MGGLGRWPATRLTARSRSRSAVMIHVFTPRTMTTSPRPSPWIASASSGSTGPTPETLAAFDMDELYGYRPEHWMHFQPWPQVDFAAEREHDILEAESDIDRWYGRAREEEEDESVDEAGALDPLDESPIAGAAASSSGGPVAGSASQPTAAKPSEACSSTALPDTDMPACPCEVVCIRYFSKGGC
ncbi:unnamed protein product [Prorocentrum cordatum]|uniref:Uncharacterized protein n=1 Tax=Prorocentrum cordatum TaxID=2364126 RepID=A0ABN9W8N2_9DINO|nr:unnamed protein product [Polarella glacialis]